MDRKILIWGGALIILVAAGFTYYRVTQPPPEPLIPAVVAPAPIETTPPPAVAAPIANPVPEATQPSAPLPTLAESDVPLLSSLEQNAGSPTLASLLRPENLIQRIVGTTDNLARERLNPELRPARRAEGKFIALGPDDGAVMGPRNAERYAPYMRALAGLDMERVAAIYFHFYPLFQEAYRDLGNPDAYFNDRLVQVIDHLLATPEVTEPVRLVRPNVMYEFADPALQSLSSGQKLLIRIGAENRGVVLARLRELRAAVAKQPVTPELQAPAPTQ